MFVRDFRTTVPNEPGTSFQAAEFTFTFQGVNETTKSNGDVDSIAVFGVAKNGRQAGTIEPSILFHARQNQTTRHVDIISEPLRDVFFIFEGMDASGNLSVNVLFNPLVSWAWFGFALLIAGTTIAVWPKKAAA
jgi:cytochrome c-type biogenesis protein CcmF